MNVVQPIAPQHAAQAYLPERGRQGTALCLSGGGFRAALFHLGVVRRLYELGVLDELRTISSVSGGSCIAAFLASRCQEWRHRDLEPAEWEQRIAEPFRRFVSQNLNTLPILIGWLPWNWGRNAGIKAFADACVARGLTSQTTLTLPNDPTFLFEATDLVTGKAWTFGPARDRAERRIALAVAVSSSAPGFFRPFIEKSPEHIALVDGGLNDNSAVEPVWRTHRRLLISDGGDVLRPRRGDSVLWSLARSAQVLFNQSGAIHKRWVISNFLAKKLDGAYWSIESSPMRYVAQPGREPFRGYTPELARDVISQIRTDYDAFSHEEAAVLENHGYFMAEAAARTHLGALVRYQRPMHVPHPGWMNEAKVRGALRSSHKKKPFKRRRLAKS